MYLSYLEFRKVKTFFRVKKKYILADLEYKLIEQTSKINFVYLGSFAKLSSNNRHFMGTVKY